MSVDCVQVTYRNWAEVLLIVFYSLPKAWMHISVPCCLYLM